MQPCRYIHWRFRFLVALATVRDLLLCAKHLFVEATQARSCWSGPSVRRKRRNIAGLPSCYHDDGNSRTPTSDGMTRARMIKIQIKRTSNGCIIAASRACGSATGSARS